MKSYGHSRKTLEEAGYELLKKDGNSAIVRNLETGRAEMYTQTDDYSGHVLEIDGMGYEFIREVRYRPNSVQGEEEKDYHKMKRSFWHEIRLEFNTQVDEDIVKLAMGMLGEAIQTGRVRSRMAGAIQNHLIDSGQAEAVCDALLKAYTFIDDFSNALIKSGMLAKQ